MESNVSYLIYRICSEKLYFEHDNKEYILKCPSLSIKYEAERLYSSILENNKFSDVMRRSDAEYWLRKLKLWNQDNDKQISQLEKTIDKTKLDLYSSRLNTNRIKSIRKDLDLYKESLISLYEKKHSLDYLTLEDYAQTRKTEFVIINTLYDKLSKKRVFSKNLEANDQHFFNILISCIHSYNISNNEFKEVARSEHWRSIWNCNKNNVFGKSPVLLTEEQKSLINLSMMYDRIYEHPECPDEKIIADDDMLDGWMLYQKQKNDEQKKENETNSVYDKHRNAKEMFIVADRESASEIIGLNSLESQRIIKQRENLIKNNEQGINVIDLPDIKSELLQQLNSQRKK